MRRTLSIGLTLGALLVVGGAPPSSAASDPLSTLKAGPAPAVPYGIGERLYGYGTVAIPAAFRYSSNHTFSYIAAARGVIWAGTAYGATDCGTILNVWVRGTAPKSLDSSYPDSCEDPVAATLGGLGITAGTVRARTSAGKLYATYPRTAATGQGCGAFDQDDQVAAAGYRVLVKEVNFGSGCSPTVEGTYLWYPGSGKQKLPNTYDVLGRLGVGWLGAQVSAGCWLVAPATNPRALSTTRLCSQQKPLVSADGKTAVLVQSGRVRVVRVADNSTVSRAALPAMTPTTQNIELPATWESSSYYLVEVRYGTDLGLVRCAVTTGACNIAVRSYVRGQITDIVTERKKGP